MIKDFVSHAEGRGVTTLTAMLKQATPFQVRTTQDLEPVLPLDPVLVLANNLLSRGSPTLASPYLQNLFSQHFLSPLQSHTHYWDDLLAACDLRMVQSMIKSGLQPDSPLSADYLDLLQWTLTPLAVAKLQKALLQLIMAGTLSLEQDQWNLLVVERDVPCGSIAIQDLSLLFRHLFILEGKGRRLPEIRLRILPGDAFVQATLNQSHHQKGFFLDQQESLQRFDACLDIAQLPAAYYPKLTRPLSPVWVQIRPETTPTQEVPSSFLFSGPLEYPPMGHYEGNLHFTFYMDQVRQSLSYLSQWVLQQDLGKNGQVAVLDRMLQGKDTLAVFPAESSHWETVTLAAFLQPGKTLITHPHPHGLEPMRRHLKALAIEGVATAENAPMDHPCLLYLITGSSLFNASLRALLNRVQALASPLAQIVAYQAESSSLWGTDYELGYTQLGRMLRTFRSHTPLPVTAWTGPTAPEAIKDIAATFHLREEALLLAPQQRFDRALKRLELVTVPFQHSEGLLNNREKELSLAKFPLIKRLLGKQLGEGESGKGIIYYAQEHPYATKSAQSLVNYLSAGESEQLEWLRLEKGATERTGTSPARQLEHFYEGQARILVQEMGQALGADHPQLAFTLHYHLPAQVEGFFQHISGGHEEAQKVIHYLLYNPQDSLAQDKFLNAQFRDHQHLEAGKAPLIALYVMDELLSEIRYPEGFFLRYLEGACREAFGIPVRLGLEEQGSPELVVYYKEASHSQAPRGGQPQEKLVGRIALADLSIRNQASPTDAHALPLLEQLQGLLRPHGSTEEILAWLKQRKCQGLEGAIQEGTGQAFTLILGASNDIPGMIIDILHAEGYGHLEESMIRQLGEVSASGETFLHLLRQVYKDTLASRIREIEYQLRHPSLNYQPARLQQTLKRLQLAPPELDLGVETRKALTQLYYKLRLTRDTRRAIFRLINLGLVTEVAMHPGQAYWVLSVVPKTGHEVLQALEAYLSRYLLPGQVPAWLEKARQRDPDTSLIRNCLFTLIDFEYREIARRRKLAGSFFRDACKRGVQGGELAFRRYLLSYVYHGFTLSPFLPLATQNGADHFATVKHYMAFFQQAPEPLRWLSPKGLAFHLIHSCRSVQRELAMENASLFLLEAMGHLIWAAGHHEASQHLELALEAYKKGFQLLAQKSEPDTWAEAIRAYKAFVMEIDPSLESWLEGAEAINYAAYYAGWLETFTQRFFDFV